MPDRTCRSRLYVMPVSSRIARSGDLPTGRRRLVTIDPRGRRRCSCRSCSSTGADRFGERSGAIGPYGAPDPSCHTRRCVARASFHSASVRPACLPQSDRPRCAGARLQHAAPSMSLHARCHLDRFAPPSVSRALILGPAHAGTSPPLGPASSRHRCRGAPALVDHNRIRTHRSSCIECAQKYHGHPR